MSLRPRSPSRLFGEPKRWLLLGLTLFACEPGMLLGEVVGAAGGVAGAEVTGGAGGDDAAPVLAGGGAGGDGGEAGEPAGGAPPACFSGDGDPGQNGVYNDGPLPAPWQTSFEDGFCGYVADAGFCYPVGYYSIVSSPVRTGAYAAAFEIGMQGPPGFRQARCVREGQLPTEAYYGAWYYLPEPVSDTNNWNLFHFRGGEPGAELHGLWDVSLTALPSGEVAAYLRDNLAVRVHEQSTPVPVPIGRWFQLELFFKRSPSPTGEVALFQDGVEVLRVSEVRTDDSSFGQWYVGNLAAALSPGQYTLYVDDVTVRLGP